jgi:hypothetical protein
MQFNDGYYSSSNVDRTSEQVFGDKGIQRTARCHTPSQYHGEKEEGAKELCR